MKLTLTEAGTYDKKKEKPSSSSINFFFFCFCETFQNSLFFGVWLVSARWNCFDRAKLDFWANISVPEKNLRVPIYEIDDI